ncbi:hypothetical protein NO932_17340 [Pelagibacterium sp. 26DY04]|uniref:MauE/DoxX family redox-associated membrane protein n=1 Tax=Pelagibacterium sp. 26DY04 TaxID=2967130 RepID=UPI0028169A34|nr:MauE/DoxX family redox-associated membrane protein [Pelagibacterium sp. 26DY04]WMT86641.1 hypothetical protein NO932_17340 [Pelagibacterium sp. 26DY04]
MSELTSLLAGTAGAFTALLFARAAWHKLSDFTEFTGFVADYELVPERLVRPVSAVIVAAETLVVLAFLVPGGAPVGALVAAALLLAYAGGMAINLNRGRDRIECGCGGAAQPLSWSLIARNGVLALFAATALLAPIALDLEGAIAAIGAGFTLWLGFVAVEQLLANAALFSLKR